VPPQLEPHLRRQVEVDSIPFRIRPVLRPERLRLLQQAGELVPTSLWTAEEFRQKFGPVYDTLDKSVKVELEQRTVEVSRLNDVLDHLEDSGGDASRIDLPRLYTVLREITDLGAFRQTGLQRIAKIKGGEGKEGETVSEVWLELDRKRERQMRGEVTDSEFQRRADEQEDRIDKEVDRLLAKPQALARVERQLGPGWARRTGVKWGVGAPAPAPEPSGGGGKDKKKHGK
jgi:hypothetical protein